jgi:DNA-binding XRE family transcriptional regulator
MPAPSKKTPERIVNLKAAAAFDATIEEMAFYVGVTKQTLYNWFKEDPDLFDEIERLRNKPVLTARQTVVGSLSDPNYAFRYLEKKRPQEFNPATKVEHSGSVETPVPQEQLHSAAAQALREEYETRLRSTIINPPTNTNEIIIGTKVEAPTSQGIDINL